MKIGIIGTGRIGNVEGRLWIKAGHNIMYGSRNPENSKYKNLHPEAEQGTIQQAIAFGDVVLLATPWEVAEEILSDKKPFEGKIIIDATNAYKKNDPAKPQEESNLYLAEFPNGQSSITERTERLKPIPIVKAYNTLTSGFQLESAGRTGQNRVVMPFAGEDEKAKETVAKLIKDSGFEPFDVGNANMARFIDPPRGDRSLYGEEWHKDTVSTALEKLKMRSNMQKLNH